MTEHTCRYTPTLMTRVYGDRLYLSLGDTRFLIRFRMPLNPADYLVTLVCSYLMESAPGSSVSELVLRQVVIHGILK